ncbi:conserved hypothetical protein [Ricinus communis]|uniref:Uncharacterized protein n=1 Tax=Ricinus communis TaxID=3988 RepID=B9S754_RICCO|nr:conserved hypothetical protein [Ricinus communis]
MNLVNWSIVTAPKRQGVCDMEGLIKAAPIIELGLQSCVSNGLDTLFWLDS